MRGVRLAFLNQHITTKRLVCRQLPCLRRQSLPFKSGMVQIGVTGDLIRVHHVGLTHDHPSPAGSGRTPVPLGNHASSRATSRSGLGVDRTETRFVILGPLHARAASTSTSTIAGLLFSLVLSRAKQFVRSLLSSKFTFDGRLFGELFVKLLCPCCMCPSGVEHSLLPSAAHSPMGCKRFVADSKGLRLSQAHSRAGEAAMPFGLDWSTWWAW